MADLYLGVGLGMGGFSKLHVLKLVRGDSFDNADALQMFINEARVTALLNHPNVVQTYEVSEDKGTVFMVMEYLDGQSLDVILGQIQRNGTAGGVDMGMRMRMRVVADVLNGLHHAHELRDLEGQPLRLVHRDVTPQNIFVTYDGSIKLLDFGVAKTTSASSPTRVGTIKGKVAYMAPEQVNSPSKVSRATDIFQIGLVLWEGVIGRSIWQGLSEYEVLLKLSSNAALPCEAPASADPELVRICRRATALAPDERYATAEDFSRDLEAFMTARDIRVTAKQIGAFVAGLFEQRRVEVRDAIQRRLKAIQEESADSNAEESEALTDVFPIMLGVSTQSGSGKVESARTGPRASSASRLSPGGVSPPVLSVAALPQRIWRNTAIAAVVLAAILTGAVLAMVAAPRRESESGRAAPHATAAPAAVAPAAGRIVDPSPQQVELSVQAIPANARLYLDEGLLPANPFIGRVPRDGSVHVLRAEADGYEKASLMVRFDGNTKNVLRLPERSVSPETGAPRLPHPSKKATAGPSHAQSLARPSPRQVTPEPQVKGSQEAAPAVHLDNSDPWK
jgi:serine/threonine-protein kinase